MLFTLTELFLYFISSHNYVVCLKFLPIRYTYTLDQPPVGLWIQIVVSITISTTYSSDYFARFVTPKRCFAIFSDQPCNRIEAQKSLSTFFVTIFIFKILESSHLSTDTYILTPKNYFQYANMYLHLHESKSVSCKPLISNERREATHLVT